MKYLLALIPVLTVLVISLLLARRFDTSEKIDKGIELCYWKLSYRRKFIRTLWMLPIMVVLIICFYITFQSILKTCIIVIVLGILFLSQAIYNFTKWKNEK